MEIEMSLTQRMLTFALATALMPAAPALSETVARHWIGTATVSNNADSAAPAVVATVPLQLDLAAPAKNGTIKGSFVNGNERAESTSGTLTGSHLVLRFHSYARTLEGDINGTNFTGTFGGARIKTWPVTLHVDRDGGKLPSTYAAGTTKEKSGTINGKWEVAVHTKNGESAWGMDVTPFSGNGEIRVVIQRIDGDSGSLYGKFDEAAQEYRVSHFNDTGATIYSLKPKGDGTLQVTNLRNPAESNVARPAAEARKENLPPPTEATQQTTMPDPKEPLRFSGPNLAGTVITEKDDQFKGKVVIVAIGGSWCPNCHDEAPMLVDLYNKYHSRGLEIVDLSFEEDDQLKNPTRLRAFVTQYNIPYTVLLMGTPDDLNDRLPQPKNLNCWPTSFFIGRDGLVKEIHAGFSGPATGADFTKLKAETTAMVEKLLAQNNTASR
jgi:thiol-disulfide isomerase/thioredoxin